TLGDLDQLAPKQKPTRTMDTELRANAPVTGGSTVGATSGQSTPAPKDALDVSEMKKFQGRWKVALFSQAGAVVPADKLAEMKMEVSSDGSRVTITGAMVPTQVDEVLKLDPAASPKQLDSKDGTTGKVQRFVYEFVGDSKLRLRGGEPGTPRPTKLGPTEPG